MKKRKVLLNRKPRVRRERDPMPWRYCILTLVCGLLFVSGFFLAATNHFSSMDYGMKNAKLRRQIEEIKSQNRRLLLSREISLSPAGIKKAGLKIGLSELTATNIEIVAKQKIESDKSLDRKGVKRDTSINTSVEAAIRNDSIASNRGIKKTGSVQSAIPHSEEKRSQANKIEDDLIALERKISMNARRR